MHFQFVDVEYRQACVCGCSELIRTSASLRNNPTVLRLPVGHIFSLAHFAFRMVAWSFISCPGAHTCVPATTEPLASSAKPREAGLGQPVLSHQMSISELP